MSRNEQVTVCGRDLWGLVVELDNGFRVRFELEAWERLRLYLGQRVSVRRPGRAEELLFIAGDVPLPPIVWVTFAARIVRQRLAATRSAP